MWSLDANAELSTNPPTGRSRLADVPLCYEPNSDFEHYASLYEGEYVWLGERTADNEWLVGTNDSDPLYDWQHTAL